MTALMRCVNPTANATHRTRDLGRGVVMGRCAGVPPVYVIRWPEMTVVGDQPTLWGYYPAPDVRIEDDPSWTHRPTLDDLFNTVRSDVGRAPATKLTPDDWRRLIAVVEHGLNAPPAPTYFVVPPFVMHRPDALAVLDDMRRRKRESIAFDLIVWPDGRTEPYFIEDDPS